MNDFYRFYDGRPMAMAKKQKKNSITQKLIDE